MEKFYNEELKNKFLTSSGISRTTKKSLNDMFVNSADIEAMLGKDLCFFNFMDFKILFSLLQVSLGTIAFYKIHLTTYLDFCVNCNVCDETSLSAIRIFDVAKDVDLTSITYNCYFKDIDDYLDYMEMIYKDMKIEQSCMSIVAFGLILCGIDKEDVFSIERKSIFDYEKNRGLIYNGEKIVLPERFLQYCKTTSMTSSYPFKYSNVEYANTPYLIRGRKMKSSKNEPLHYSSFSYRDKFISKRTEEYNGDRIDWLKKCVKPNFLQSNYMFLKWKNTYGKNVPYEALKEYDKDITEIGYCLKKQEYLFWLKIYHNM